MPRNSDHFRWPPSRHRPPPRSWPAQGRTRPTPQGCELSRRRRLVSLSAKLRLSTSANEGTSCAQESVQRHPQAWRTSDAHIRRAQHVGLHRRVQKVPAVGVLVVVHQDPMVYLCYRVAGVSAMRQRPRPSLRRTGPICTLVNHESLMLSTILSQVRSQGARSVAETCARRASNGQSGRWTGSAEGSHLAPLVQAAGHWRAGLKLKARKRCERRDGGEREHLLREISPMDGEQVQYCRRSRCS